MPELISFRNHGRPHGAVFVRTLRPCQIRGGVNPQCEAHWEYDASRAPRGWTAHFHTRFGYTGYVAHEYRPALGRDARESVKQAIEIMTV
jgi:hypothetical protein